MCTEIRLSTRRNTYHGYFNDRTNRTRRFLVWQKRMICSEEAPVKLKNSFYSGLGPPTNKSPAKYLQIEHIVPQSWLHWSNLIAEVKKPYDIACTTRLVNSNENSERGNKYLPLVDFTDDAAAAFDRTYSPSEVW